MTSPFESVRLVVPIEKLRDYALSPTHRTGRHKARVFRTVLGLTATDAEWLQDQILTEAQARRSEFRETTVDEHGPRFVFDLQLTTVIGASTVRTGWIFRARVNELQLTSCYIP